MRETSGQHHVNYENLNCRHNSKSCYFDSINIICYRSVFTRSPRFPTIVFYQQSALCGSVSAFISMSFICVRGQIALATKELVYLEKPVSTAGCTYEFEPVISLANQKAQRHYCNSYIYTMSFTYYSAVGCFLTIAVANLASFVFGRNDVTTMNRKLLVPCIRRFIKSKEYDGVEKEEKPVIRFDLKSDLT